MSPFKKYVIFDIDGTLAEIPKEHLDFIKSGSQDWDKFYDHHFDYKPMQDMVDLAKVLINSKKYIVIFLTGRSRRSYVKTREWLFEHVGRSEMLHCFLLMRPDGDERDDVSVKTDLFLSCVDEDFSRIALVFEDKDSLVRAWRDSGVTCLQVEEGDY